MTVFVFLKNIYFVEEGGLQQRQWGGQLVFLCSEPGWEKQNNDNVVRDNRNNSDVENDEDNVNDYDDGDDDHGQNHDHNGDDMQVTVPLQHWPHLTPRYRRHAR